MRELYKNTVEAEKNTLLELLSSQIIPQGYEYLRLVEPESKSKIVNKRSQKFITAFEEVLTLEETLKELQVGTDMQKVGEARTQILQASETVNKLLSLLPKSEKWPEFEDYMLQY